VPTARSERVRRDPAFAALKETAIALTGLRYWDDKDEALADLLAPLAESRHGGVAGLVERLAAEGGRGPMSEAVVDAVTVGETFFFRYREQFDALEQVVVPEVMARNHTRRRLSLWSAGCSNGAETYSLSIMLARRFGALLADWDVDIVGSDISAGALAIAVAGKYGAWTVRDLPTELRQECFSTEGGVWHVKPPYRRGVRFLRHNLITQPPPGDAFDVVLCRNVLMYFDPPTRMRVLRSLHSSLAEGGWLVVGHAETGPLLAQVFTPMPLPGCTLYRKLGNAGITVPERGAHVPAMPALPSAAPNWSAEIRALLDRGAFMMAARHCRTWADMHPLDPAPHYFLGLALEPLAEDQAVAAYRRALFLSSGLVMAHFHLFRLLLRRGEQRAARRHHAALIAELEAVPPDQPLPLGGGLTARELAAVVRRLERSR
jgi:chemotaxis protein methyltransferase CheR